MVSAEIPAYHIGYPLHWQLIKECSLTFGVSENVLTLMVYGKDALDGCKCGFPVFWWSLKKCPFPLVVSGKWPPYIDGHCSSPLLWRSVVEVPSTIREKSFLFYPWGVKKKCVSGYFPERQKQRFHWSQICIWLCWVTLGSNFWKHREINLPLIKEPLLISGGILVRKGWSRQFWNSV